MTGPDKNEWDRFQTVGKQLGERRRQGSWAGWAGLVLLGSLLGFIIFPIVVLIIALTFFSADFFNGFHQMNFGMMLLRSILEDRPERERIQVLGLMAIMFILVGAGIVLGLHVGQTVSPKAGWLTCIGLVNLGVAVTLGGLEWLRRRRERKEEQDNQTRREQIKRIREQIANNRDF